MESQTLLSRVKKAKIEESRVDPPRISVFGKVMGEFLLWLLNDGQTEDQKKDPKSEEVEKWVSTNVKACRGISEAKIQLTQNCASYFEYMRSRVIGGYIKPHYELQKVEREIKGEKKQVERWVIKNDEEKDAVLKKMCKYWGFDSVPYCVQDELFKNIEKLVNILFLL